ncbi:MAG TPA: carboxylating nicotinate-nucleotide diphosphorylase [Acidimicrobiales bacterium]
MPERDDVHPPIQAIRPIVTLALEEDLLPLGDLTSMLLDPAKLAEAHFVARRPGVVAGTRTVLEVCRQVDSELACSIVLDDGDHVPAGGVIATVRGPFASILSAERTALNFLSHLSGVATLTERFVQSAKVGGSAARVWDTRKTTPGLRSLEKAAVRAGGGWNHRGNLSEAILIKDNHLGGISIADAVGRARLRWPGRMVEVECDSLALVGEAVTAGATLVLCDNMTPEEVQEAVQIASEPPAAAARSLIEASGGVTLENIAAYAAAGADLISVGALTHSAPILDIGLDLA